MLHGKLKSVLKSRNLTLSENLKGSKLFLAFYEKLFTFAQKIREKKRK